jgi:membrane-associated phospholipid phosphatase
LQAANRLALVRVSVRCYAVAFAALAGFFALGYFLRSHGEPATFVGWARALFDHSTLVAWWITWACYPQALIPLCFVLLILAWRLPAWRSRILLSIVSLIVSWRAADYFQHFFARPRPLDWVVKHETSFSYPSSHAAIVTGFYALWAVLLYASELPNRARAIAATLLTLFSIAILWSRLALGAHFITDLAGGILLGIAVVAMSLGVYAAGIFGRPAGRLFRAAE